MLNASFTFIRHARPGFADKDKMRPLNEEGLRQAQVRGINLKTVPFDLIITSSALRAQETTNEILKQINPIARPVVEVDELYLPLDPSAQKEVEKLIDQFEKSSVKELIDNDVEKNWGLYVELAWKAIISEVEKYHAKKILVVGHGKIINCLGLFVEPSATELLEVNFGYCEGFELTTLGDVHYIR